MHIGKELEAH